MNPNRIFGLIGAIATLPIDFSEQPVNAKVGHSPPPHEGKGLPMPKQRHQGGCNSAGCRTGSKCICSCKKCRAGCSGRQEAIPDCTCDHCPEEHNTRRGCDVADCSCTTYPSDAHQAAQMARWEAEAKS